MSIEAVSWALNQNIVTDSPARFVLVGLANHSDTQNYAFPSVKKLSLYTGLSERCVQKKLRDLVEVGAISIGNQALVAAHIPRADHRPICYRLHIERGEHCAPRKERGESDAENGVNVTTKRGEPGAPESSVKPKSKPNRKSKEGTTLREWEDSIPKDQDVIPPGSLPFRYAQSIELPIEFLWLAWTKFEEYYLYGNGASKRYSNWLLTFKNAVEDYLHQLWYLNDAGEYVLTTKGKMRQKAMEAEAHGI